MRNLLQLTVLCATLLLAGITESAAQNRSGVVFTPEGFDPQKHILLVAEMPRLKKTDERNESATKSLDNALKKNYPYKYEIVSLKAIYEDSTKYADTSVYRYALINNLSSYQRTTTTTITSSGGSHSVSPSANVTSIDFAFYDRTAKKEGPDSGWHSSFIGMTMKKVIGIIKKEKGLK